MSSPIGEDVRRFLMAQADIAAAVDDRIYQNKAPQEDKNPVPPSYIWYRRGTSDNEDTTLDETGTDVQFRETFDIEACGYSLSDVLSLAAFVKRTNQHRGTFGDGSAQGVFITDHNDNYRPTNADPERGKHVASLEMEIVGYEGP